QQWGGILVEGDNIATLEVGDRITITAGTVNERFGTTRISGAQFTREGTGDAPAPVAIPLNTFTQGTLDRPTRGVEAYEGMLVHVTGALEVIDLMPDPTFDPLKMDWRVGLSGASNGLRVATGGATTDPTSTEVSYINSEEWAPSLNPGVTPCALEAGTKLDTLIGIVFYDRSVTRLLPRSNDDIAT